MIVEDEVDEGVIDDDRDGDCVADAEDEVVGVLD